MKQKLLHTFRLRTLMLAALLTSAISAWAEEQLIYTLTPEKGSNNGYASNCDITINDITWNLAGNSDIIPWRIGGKSLSKVDRALYSKTPIDKNVSKIEVTHGSASSITVHSWTLYVATDAEFENIVSAMTPTFEASKTTTISRPEGKDWSNCYYKFVYKVTVSGTSNKFIEFKEAKFYEEEEQTSAVATTTTIDASGITNKDVYVGTDAGTLSATVKDNGDNVIDDAAVTWTSSEPEVATIDASGAVTLVAAGTTTITASYAGETDTYKPSTATYELTVTSSAPYTQPTEVTINMNYQWLGSGNGSNIDASKLPVVNTDDNVKTTITDGTSTRPRGDADYIRLYKGSTLTFEAPDGYNITGITFTTGGNNTWTTPTVSPETISDKTWTGAADKVVFTLANGNCFIKSAVVTLAKPSSIATPTFSVAAGTYEEEQTVELSCETEGASIYYTTDGTEPTAESTGYEGAITVSESMTIKAIAVKDGESSNVASATYTINLPLTTVAQVKEASAGTAVTWDLTGSQVVFISGDYLYVRDNTGGICLYKSGIDVKTGDFLSGKVKATYGLFNGLPQLKTFTEKEVTTTSNETVLPTIVTTKDEAEANVCNLVKFEGVELTQSGSKYYIGETGVQLYDNFKIGYTATTDKSADVSGVVLVYNSTIEVAPRFESDIVYLESSESVSIGTTGYSTFASDKALDFSGTDAIKVFYATVEGSTMTFHQIRKVAAGTGVLLVSAEGGAVEATNVPYLADDATADGAEADETENNVFVRGTGEAVSYSDDDQNYILYNGADGIGFYRAKNNKVAANRAYVHVEGTVGVKSFLIDLEDDATGIDEMKNEELRMKNGSAVFNLAGQRISRMQKGINIVNGKKVIIK